MITGNEMWLSQNNVSDKEKFQKSVNATGMLQSAMSMPLDQVKAITYNSEADDFKLKYVNEKGKNKSLKLDLQDPERSNRFAEFLAGELGMSKSESTENQTKPLLRNAGFLLVTIALTVFLAMMDDTSQLDDSGSRRTRSKGALVRWIIETIGSTGVIIVGSLLSLLFAHKLYQRFKNPAMEVAYSRS